MFIPNLIGQLYRREAYNRYGQARHGDAVACPFAFVNISIGAEKTSVRADSSASRGAADEMLAERAKILVAKFISISVGDKFAFEGQSYLVQAVHARRNVFGRIDHFECDLELLTE